MLDLKKYCFLLGLFSTQWLFGNDFGLKSVCDSLKNKPKDEILLKFPYKDYASQLNVYALKGMDKDAQFIEQSLHCAKDILYQTLQYRFLKDSIRLDTPIFVLSLLEIASFYSQVHADWVQYPEVYQTVADEIFSKITRNLEQGIDKHQVSKSHPDIQYLIRRLAAAQYHVSYKVSDSDKFWTNLKKGNLTYLADRARIKAKENYKILIISILSIFLFASALRLRKIYKPIV